MAQGTREAELLHSISMALGVSANVFLDDQVHPNKLPDDYHALILFIRLTRAFRSLPSDDQRLELLRLVEQYAAQFAPDNDKV